ncbi:MAG TPA: DMT family transporter [Spirochaetia bacterium]|nr:DMT family transporter [Spirochaetia bacterium]
MKTAKRPGGPALGYLCIALATVLFSTMEIALKSVAGRWRPLQLNFLRFLVGGIFLLPFALRALRRRGARIEGRDLGFLALSGFACVVASMTLYQLSIQYCAASIVAVLFSCNPVFTIPLAAAFLKERVRPSTAASMALSLAGMASILNPLGWGGPGPASGGAGASAAGIALVLGAAAAFAAYSVMGKARGPRLGGLAVTAGSFLAGGAELLVLILASRLPPVAAALRAAGLASFAAIPILAGLDAASAPIFAYIALGVTGIGFASHLTAVELSSAATASLVFYIKPALASILAYLILGEAIAPATIAGIGLVAAGSAIAFIGARRAARPA